MDDPDIHPAAPADGGGGEEEEEEDIPVPMKVGALDWSKYVQDPNDPIKDPSFCPLCRYAACVASQVAAGNQAWIDILKYKKTNRNTEHPFSGSRAIQKLWNDGVRYNLTDDKGIPLPEGFDPGPWPAQQIFEHDLLHVVDPDVVDLENVRTCQLMVRTLATNCRLIDRKGNITVDLKCMKMYFDAVKQMQAITDKVRKHTG